ncbi:MAG: hypothetical protein WBI53_07315 [Paludibacter sp.]
MKKIIVLLLFVTGFISVFTSCKNEVDENYISEKSKQEIKSTYASISSSANELLTGDNALTELQKMITTYESYPGVEKVWMLENTLYVKFKEGGTISWSVQPDLIKLPYDIPRSKIASKIKEYAFANSINTPTNKKALLINQVYNDESFDSCKKIITNIETELKKINFSVVIKNGSDADLDLFGSNLCDYGLIFNISHGCFDGTNTWIATGEECKISIIDILTNKDYFLLWKLNTISVMTVDVVRNGEKTSASFFKFSQKYIDEKYKANSFPNSIIYIASCQALKSENLAKVFSDKGAGVTIGWSDTDGLGPYTGIQLLNMLIGGNDVSTAFANLPENSKIDIREDKETKVKTTAELRYSPSSGGNMCLTAKKDTKVVIEYPQNNSNVSERVIQLSGHFDGYEELTKGTVEVNGKTTKLNITDDTFSQPILIISGTNKIKVNCYGNLSDGTTSFSSVEIMINGDFPILDLFTELRWNSDFSDVDFHLLPPNSSISDLWTSKDCYYYNKATSWNGFLDVDNTFGYGPEHISIPKVLIQGIYTLYVHYYQNKGTEHTDAFIDVSVKNGTNNSFGPFSFSNPGVYSNETTSGGSNRGDLWEICKIDFPSGNITEVNKYYYLGNTIYKSMNVQRMKMSANKKD